MIESIIVKIMKSRKTCNHIELVEESIKIAKLNSHFEPDPILVK